MTKIKIHNFRQISDAEIEIKDFLLLIGEQASGKSTIAKLIYFFKSINHRLYSILMRFNDEEIIITEFIKDIKDYFKKSFGPFDDKAFSLTFSYSRKNDISINNTNEGIEININKDYKHSIQRVVKQYLKSLSAIKYAIDPDGNKAELAYAATEEIFSASKNFVFLPAGRGITVSYSERFQQDFFALLGDDSLDDVILKAFMRHSKGLIDYFSKQDGFNELTKDDKFHKLINNYVSNVLKGKYDSQGYEKIYYSENESIPLKRSSSGQQESVRIIQDAIYILEKGQKVSRIIEEPEAHLFPKAQDALVKLLVLIFNQLHSQLIITTHSLHVLASFNNLLYYTKKLKRLPERRSEIEQVFNTNGLREEEKLNINPDKFQAYWLDTNSDVYCKTIFDLEDAKELIGDNAIDLASNEIFGDFDKLYDID